MNIGEFLNDTVVNAQKYSSELDFNNEIKLAIHKYTEETEKYIMSSGNKDLKGWLTMTFIAGYLLKIRLDKLALEKFNKGEE